MEASARTSKILVRSFFTLVVVLYLAMSLFSSRIQAQFITTPEQVDGVSAVD